MDVSICILFEMGNAATISLQTVFGVRGTYNPSNPLVHSVTYSKDGVLDATVQGAR